MKSIYTATEPKERARERMNYWYNANKHRPGFQEDRSARLLKWRKEHPEKYLLQHARSRAKLRSLPINIELIDIVIPDKCPVLNMPFEYGTEYGMSLDRIDSSKGYIKGNIQVISKKANVMKNNATIEELRNFVIWANQFTR